MTNQNIILIFLFLGLMTLNSCSTPKLEICKGKLGSIEYQNTYIKTNRFEGVIFSKDYIGISNNFNDKFTPTINDINLAESILKGQIKEINYSRPNQMEGCPVIHKNLSKYKRQYFGYINPTGDKIIFINCFWDKKFIIDKISYNEPEDKSWRTEEKIVLDGCSYYWEINVNLVKRKIFGLGVNGPG